jgi:HK97 family phage major capsid protein
LPPMFDANAVWMMKKEVFNNLRKETDSIGRPVIDLGIGYNNFGEGVAGYAAGLPIVMSDYKTSALGSRGDVVLGDWKTGYFIGERKTLSVEMSRHLLFKQNMTAFRASARVGGTPAQEKAFVILDDDADANMS